MIRLTELLDDETLRKRGNPMIPNEAIKKLFKQLFKTDSDRNYEEFTARSMKFHKDKHPYISVQSFINGSSVKVSASSLKLKLKKYF